MSALLDYEQVVEVHASVFKRLRDCSNDELHSAMECQQARRELRDQAEALLAEAARHDIPISESLRAALCVFAGDLPTLTGLVDELRAVCLQPA